MVDGLSSFWLHLIGRSILWPRDQKPHTACRTTAWGFYVPLYSFAVRWGNLERQLQSKLNLSRCRHRAQNSAGAGVHHACGQQSRPVCLIGYPEVRMVEDVEHLGAEVQRLGLPQHELLEEREIAAHEFRANQRVPAKITDRAGGLQHKRACVVPALGIAEDRIVGRAWPDVRPFVNGEINGVQVSRLVVAEPHFKWSARLRCHDAVELLASHQQPG